MNKSALLIGLPGTGKSTYLAALFHILVSQEIPGSLRLAGLSENRAHINHLRKMWLEYKELYHTPSESNVEVEMMLSSSNGELKLNIPDLPGERFERWLTDRQWPEEMGQAVRACDGFLVFLHPEKVVPHANISEFEREFAHLLDDSVRENDMPQPFFEYKNSATQVHLIDLIQILQEIRSDRKFKLALVISAFDLVVKPVKGLKEQPDNPDDWLKQRAPMLQQYLAANFPNNLKIFGVSAQGGDLKDSQEREELLQKTIEERVWIIEGKKKHADLSSPLRWLLELDESVRN